MSALQPLAPLQSVNFPSDREYTHNALIEELVLIERHLRDESWRLCNCNPEKHLPAIAALGSEGQGFAKTDNEREFMRKLQVRARIWKDKIKQGEFNDKDADKLRAMVREFRHRIEFQTWTGPMEETPELMEVVTQIHALTGDIPTLEEKQVDQILDHLSEKHGIPKPGYRFVDECNPLKEAWMVGADIIERDGAGNISRIPLTDMDELVFCRGGASPYAISHEFCVPSWTLIKTSDQLKEISEIVEGSKIIAHNGKMRTVNKVMSRRYSGGMYTFNIMGYPDPLVVTNNHPILAVKRSIKKLCDGRLKTLEECGEPEWVKPQELSLQDYLLSPISCEVRDDENVSEDLMRLIGYYLAEGCCGKYGKNYVVSLAFSSDEKEYIDDVVYLLATLFESKPNIQNRGSHFTITVSRRKAVEYFSQFGHGALNKYIPEWVMLLPPNKQAQLVNGYWRGDGSLQNKPRCRHYSITTRSRNLAWQVTDLLRRMKYTPSLSSCWHKSSFKPGLQYQIHIQGPDLERFSKLVGDGETFPRNRTWSLTKNDGRYTYHPIKNIKIDEVKDFPVWNLEVNEDNSYIANGVIVHNCHYKDRVQKGSTSEKSATECALSETGNSVGLRKDFYTLSTKRGIGGIMSYRAKLTKRMEGVAPLVAGVIVGEAIDASGMIDTTIAPYTGGFTGIVKGLLGLGLSAVGVGMKKGFAADVVLGAGLPIAASGIIQQFMPGGIALGVPTPVMPAPAAAPVQLTSYARPTGLRFGHPTLRVPMIPPRPGVLAPSTIPQSLAPKFILGGR